MESERSPPLGVDFANPTEKNIEQLKILNRAIFPINYQDRVYKDILACAEATQLAYHNDVLVGAMACRLEKAAEGPKLYIITLGVLAPYRGMGVGSRLVERCISHVASTLPEVQEAYLHVQSSNEEAISFYKRFGFDAGQTIENYYQKNRLDPPHAVVLRRMLGAQEQNSSGGA